MIELRDVRASFGRTIALVTMDLLIRPGVTGLFGPNGSGKSTLLRLLTGLLQPSRGQIVMDGHLVTSTDEGFRAKIGYSGHELGLYPRLTVKENIALFATLHGASRDRTPTVMRELGIEDRAGDRVDQLSAGLRRRVSIARALVHEPQLLLLDEPYANLDDDAADMVSAAVTGWRRPDRTAVIATHGAKRVKTFADAAIILKRGRVVSYRAKTDQQEPDAPEPAGRVAT